MKKFLAIVLAAVMALSMMSFASAESLAGEYEVKIYGRDHGNVREIITDTTHIIEI